MKKRIAGQPSYNGPDEKYSPSLLSRIAGFLKGGSKTYSIKRKVFPR